MSDAEFSFSKWTAHNISQIFGAGKPRISEDIYRAPVVVCNDGAVQGVFHLGSGQLVQCAMLDDLKAGVWAIV
jgi:hypothetical protein